jgi:hypothetical protein
MLVGNKQQRGRKFRAQLKKMGIKGSQVKESYYFEKD